MEKKSIFRKVLKFIVVCAITFYAVESAYAESPVKITSPLDNATFSPEDQVLVKVEAPDNSNILIGIGTGDSALLDKAPYEFKFTIPRNAALGKVGIIAGATNDKGFIGSAEININVRLSDKSGIELTKLRIYPEIDPLLLLCYPNEADRANVSIPLTVHGIFSDGVERDIASRESGTKYESSNDSVFIVAYNQYGDEASVRPVNIGEAYLTVTNGSLSKKMRIIVENNNQTQ